MVQNDPKCGSASIDFHPSAIVRLLGRMVPFAIGLGLGHGGDLAQYPDSHLADTGRLVQTACLLVLLGILKWG